MSIAEQKKKVGELATKVFSPSVTRTVSRRVLILKKDSPHIFFGLGVAGVVTSTVLACRATLRVSKILDEIQNDINDLKDLKKEIDENKTSYPVEQYYKDAFYVYTKAMVKLAKLYGPSIIIGAASIGALTGSHIQLARRNTALMAAYAAVQNAYDEYRERVREQLGPEKELDLYNAAKKELMKDEAGEITGEKKSFDPNAWSPYARFFDEGSRNFEKDAELNRLFIQCQQTYANNLLTSRGHLFLNEVYDMLDIPRSKAGAVVGWVIGKDGDNYVDFGIFKPGSAQFVNGNERAILLDFNVDGVIYDKI